MEGAPGLTVDIYGDKVLVQSWREALDDDAMESVRSGLLLLMPGVIKEVEFHLRGRAARRSEIPLHQRQRWRPEDQPEVTVLSIVDAKVSTFCETHIYSSISDAT
jgi:23S rRNA G2069 N7-methylase RlmK/C1962 C5-methylase RlmI